MALDRNLLNVTSVALGTEYEGSMEWVVKRELKAQGRPESYVSFAGTDIDRFEGADAEVDGVRVDFTAAYQKKDHMVDRGHVIDSKYYPIHFGIRTGNNSGAKFEIPVVVVVGIECTDNRHLRLYMDAIVSELKKKASVIVDTISDVFYDYCDEVGLEF